MYVEKNGHDATHDGRMRKKANRLRVGVGGDDNNYIISPFHVGTCTVYIHITHNSIII